MKDFVLDQGDLRRLRLGASRRFLPAVCLFCSLLMLVNTAVEVWLASRLAHAAHLTVGQLLHALVADFHYDEDVPGAVVEAIKHLMLAFWLGYLALLILAVAYTMRGRARLYGRLLVALGADRQTAGTGKDA